MESTAEGGAERRGAEGREELVVGGEEGGAGGGEGGGVTPRRTHEQEIRTEEDAIKYIDESGIYRPRGGVSGLMRELGGDREEREPTMEEALAQTRKAKVWNEPVYSSLSPPLSHSPSPPLLPSPSSLLLQPQWDAASKEPLKVVVEKDGRFHTDPRTIYPMHSSPRGLALIINNLKFDHQELYPYRKGAHVDSDNLESLLSQLGFQVERHENQKRNETLKTLINFADREEHSKADMVVVCMLSHGTEHGKIVSSDCLDIDAEIEILRRFNNDYCPALIGKPKFFILQACRGDEKDFGTLESAKRDETDARMTRNRSVSMSATPGQKGLTWEDMLIAFATLPGYVSNRDHFRGTWFIESLCKVFMTTAKDTSLRDMLDMVGLELRDYQSERGTKQSFSYDVRHFYKKLYFNPGFVAEQRQQWRNAPASVEGLRTRSVSTTQPPSLEAWRTLSLPEGKIGMEENVEEKEEKKEDAENTQKGKDSLMKQETM